MHVYPGSLDDLSGETVLWRYMSFAQYMSLLETESLFFSSIAKLDDEFEGSLPLGNAELRPIMMTGVPPRKHATLLREVQELAKASRRSIVVNCWHRSERESAAMWRLYAGWREGIAIKTTVSSLNHSFTGGGAQPFVLPVHYVDFCEDTIDETNFFTRYLTKSKSFEFESEVRAIEIDIPMKDGEVDQSPEAHQRPGVTRAVNVGRLIEEVIVAPGADPWFVELVQRVTARPVPAAPVRPSALSAAPRWG